MNTILRDTYLNFRTRHPAAPFSAAHALKRARELNAAGKRHYGRTDGVSFNQPNDSGACRVEHGPDALRFCGYVVSDRYRDDTLTMDAKRATGWYCDTSEDETFTAAIWQLPARDGRTRYVGGYVENYSGADGALIDFSHVYESESGEDGRESVALRDAIRSASRAAERDAEKAREYDAAWQCGAQFADIGEGMKQTRAELREVAQELRASAALPPGICRTLREAIEDKLRDLQEARKRRAELREGNNGEWSVYMSAELRDAFNDGAGIA